MNAYVLGAGSTPFQRWPDKDFRDLTEVACKEAISSAGLPDGTAVEEVYFGNCAMHVWGQSNIRGQVALGGLLQGDWLSAGIPIINVEGGCATGSLALHGAYRAVLSGQCDVALAVGVEKTWIPDDPAKSMALFSGGIDQLHRDEWLSFLSSEGETHGHPFKPHPHRIVFLDIHAMQAKRHMQVYGTTADQIAHITVKNRTHALENPRAQYRRAATIEGILNDPMIIDPLTRSMCSPISDGAAAVVVCSERFLQADSTRRERAALIRACRVQGGQFRSLNAPSVVEHCAQKAYADAGLDADDIHIAEVHDATSSCELLHYESLGFCPSGTAGGYAASGATARAGERPVNLSGGLVSKGHPLGATGLGMIQELLLQLRNEAGPLQAKRAVEHALAQNAGGSMGFDEALCAITILTKAT